MVEGINFGFRLFCNYTAQAQLCNYAAGPRHDDRELVLLRFQFPKGPRTQIIGVPLKGI